MKRIMGLDWGEKRLGLALSDEMHITAGPLGLLERKSIEHDLAELSRIIEEKDVGEIVIGLPLDLHGEKGKAAGKVEAFADRIREEFNLPVHLWDERMSTKAVERMLIQADVSRKKRRRVKDGLAASYFLQGFLDASGGGK
jgi:putative Holliday junction resolvase